MWNSSAASWTGFGARVLAALSLVVLAGGVAAIYASFRNYQQVISYRSAPACASVDDVLAYKNCRYAATGTVLVVATRDTVFFVLPGVNDRYFGARFYPEVPPGLAVLQRGDQVQVEFWSGHVTKFAGTMTANNPENGITWGELVAIGVLLGVLGLGGVFWGVVATRRVSRGDRGQRAA